MAKKKNPFSGRWRIISMIAWDEEFIDEEEEGFFEFDEKENGEFHFGYVHGRMDCRVDLGWQRRNGPGAGPGLGRDEGRGIAWDDFLPRRR
jgi:hypothetical protein